MDTKDSLEDVEMNMNYAYNPYQVEFKNPSEGDISIFENKNTEDSTAENDVESEGENETSGVSQKINRIRQRSGWKSMWDLIKGFFNCIKDPFKCIMKIIGLVAMTALLIYAIVKIVENAPDWYGKYKQFVADKKMASSRGNAAAQQYIQQNFLTRRPV